MITSCSIVLLDAEKDLQVLKADIGEPCGVDATWSYDSVNKTLTISGSGATDDYTLTSPAPWDGFEIITVNIGAEITKIGDYAFYGCTSLLFIRNASDALVIGDGAFVLGNERLPVTCYVTAPVGWEIPDNDYTNFEYSTKNWYAITWIMNALGWSVTSPTTYSPEGDIVDLRRWSWNTTLDLYIDDIFYAENVYTMPAKNVTFRFENKDVAANYTVKFLNADGSIFSKSTVAWGTIITIPDEVPVKVSTGSEVFTFAGWDGYTEGMAIHNNTIFEPIFTSVPRQYTVEFVSEGYVIWSGQVEYGTFIRIPIPDPEKESTIEHSYEFNGWSGYPIDGMLVESLVGNDGKITFVAEYVQSPRYYKISFTGYDSPRQLYLEYGALIVPPLENPIKASTSTVEYTFYAWEGHTPGMRAYGDMTFKPIFAAVPIIDPQNPDIVNGTLVINVGDSEKIEISLATFDAIIDAAPANGAEIAAGDISLEVDMTLLKYLRDKMNDGENLVMTMSPVNTSSLNKEMRDVIGDCPVYDISFGDIKSFDGGKLKIGLKYAGENIDGMKVWCVGEDGSVEAFDCIYRDGSLYFETEHLSYYAVVYDPSPVPPGVPEDNTLFLVAGLLSITIAALVAAFFFARQ